LIDRLKAQLAALKRAWLTEAVHSPTTRCGSCWRFTAVATISS